MPLTDQQKQLLQEALAEDIGSGDITTEALLTSENVLEAQILLKQEGIVCGHAIAEYVFSYFDTQANYQVLIEEGEKAEAGSSVAKVQAQMAAILKAERVALNFMQRLSGIATLTRTFVEKVKGSDAKILDTRKTTPGLRSFEKMAVVVGGGVNHRIGLYDQVLIKENHLKALQQELGGPYADMIACSIEKARLAVPKDCIIEIEVENEDEALAACAAGADIILLDNMTPEAMAQIVQNIPRQNGKPLLEASGNVSLETIEDIARTGVDHISIGAITHSALPVDISLLFI